MEYKYNETRDAIKAAEELFKNVKAAEEHVNNSDEFICKFYNSFNDYIARVKFYRNVASNNDIFSLLSIYGTSSKESIHTKRLNVTQFKKLSDVSNDFKDAWKCFNDIDAIKEWCDNEDNKPIYSQSDDCTFEEYTTRHVEDVYDYKNTTLTKDRIAAFTWESNNLAATVSWNKYVNNPYKSEEKIEYTVKREIHIFINADKLTDQVTLYQDDQVITSSIYPNRHAI